MSLKIKIEYLRQTIYGYHRRLIINIWSYPTVSADYSGMFELPKSITIIFEVFEPLFIFRKFHPY